MVASSPIDTIPIWALVQTKPKRVTLAVSSDRDWLKAEAWELAGIREESGIRKHHQLRVVELDPVRVEA